jgi:hypothetical protein
MFVLGLLAVTAMGQATPQGTPVDITKIASQGSLPVQIVVMLTLLSFIPAILIF